MSRRQPAVERHSLIAGFTRESQDQVIGVLPPGVLPRSILSTAYGGSYLSDRPNSFHVRVACLGDWYLAGLRFVTTLKEPATGRSGVQLFFGVLTRTYDRDAFVFGIEEIGNALRRDLQLSHGSSLHEVAGATSLLLLSSSGSAKRIRDAIPKPTGNLSKVRRGVRSRQKGKSINGLAFWSSLDPLPDEAESLQVLSQCAERILKSSGERYDSVSLTIVEEDWLDEAQVVRAELQASKSEEIGPVLTVTRELSI